jgi:hypothetical protein
MHFLAKLNQCCHNTSGRAGPCAYFLTKKWALYNHIRQVSHAPAHITTAYGLALKALDTHMQYQGI